MSVLTIDRRTSTGSNTGRDRPWKVIVRNDSHNSFQGVARALSDIIPGVDYEDGMRLAELIDREGSGVVWAGMRETAELYWTELQERGLTMAPLKR